MDWVHTLNKALDYMEEHLCESITVRDIAAHVYTSAAHLQRCFYSLTGLTIGEYIRNRRLTLAGHALCGEKVKVIDVALRYGYDSPESFSKAFSRFHGVTPVKARQEGVTLKSYDRLVIKIIMEGGSVMDYRIEKKEAFTVVVKAKSIGEDSAKEVPAFWTEYRKQGLDTKLIPLMGICGETRPGDKDFPYGIGCPEELALAAPEGFTKWTIPEKTWAIFKCVGAMPDAIQNMWTRIYSEWLPQAKYELNPPYDIEYYPDGDMDSPDYVSEIWVPVREK